MKKPAVYAAAVWNNWIIKNIGAEFAGDNHAKNVW